MKVFVCGDTHGTYDITKLTSKEWPEGKELTKDDFLIILGDSGINWSNNLNDRDDIYVKGWLRDKPWTTLYVDGNHMNYERMYGLPIIDFHGGKAHQINDSIFHLMRGEIFTFGDKTVFTFGGGESIDKAQRQNRVSWWEEEMPTTEEYLYAIKNLANVENYVDFILTHSCSHVTFKKIAENWDMQHKEGFEKSLRDFFDYLEDYVDFKEWHFGHFHEDGNLDDIHFVHYNEKPRRII